MKKKIVVLIFICSFFIFSCTTTKSIQNVGEITKTENGVYHVQGKYNIFTCEDENEVQIIMNHPFVFNAEYDFLKNVPHFIDYDIFRESYPNGELYYFVNYITTHGENIEVKYCQILEQDYFIVFQTTEFTNEEWDDFKGYLNDIKQLRIIEFESYKKEQEERLLKEQEELKEHYGFSDLVNYMYNIPGSILPYAGYSFYVDAPASFVIEDANIDGDGVDYLCSYVGYYGLIYIYGENLETMPNQVLDQDHPSLGTMVNVNTFNSLKPFILTYTGTSAPALSRYGNRIEVPIFIAK